MADQQVPFGADLPAWPDSDFSVFGEHETRPLPRLQALGGAFLARNWVHIPHVTHHDDADVTALRTHRQAATEAGEPSASTLAYVVRALALALCAFPTFNASLDKGKRALVLKKYVHIGVAIEVPGGLVIGVVRDCERKTPAQIGADIAALSAKARGKGLSLDEMSGGSMTVSSLAGIGGTGFTPLINAPEVAILGLVPSVWKPRRGEGGELQWWQALPLSLSYDHRVINGADAARFLRHLDGLLAAPKQLEEGGATVETEGVLEHG
jgi:pyruvate dehydrogenase E2 component (dihydrolipoamide acetyltransferase)